MKSWIRSLFAPRTSTSQASATRPASSTRLGLESLDRRDLPSISLSNGILSVSGDNSNDLVEVSINFGNSLLQTYDDKVVVSRRYGSYGSPGENLFEWLNEESDEFLIYAKDGTKIVDKVLASLGNGWNTFESFTSIPNIVIGGTDPDSFAGGSGADTLYGLGGLDTLAGKRGDDTLYGGTGSDTYVFSGEGFGSDNVIEGANADTDTLDFSAAGAQSGALRDGLHLSLFGTWGQSVLDANGSIPASYVTLSDATSIENVVGTRHHDTIWGNGRTNQINGLGGDDLLNGGWVRNYLHGGTGNDVLKGSPDARDNLYGEDGNDRLIGFGGPGTDYLSGGANDDTLVSLGGSESDTLYGGSGTDSFWYDASTAETPKDYSSAEQSARRLHGVGSFENLMFAASGTSTAVHKEKMYGVNPLPDPTDASSNLTLTSFRDVPLFPVGGPSVDDVEQGALADCWFMAKLGAFADVDPEVIYESVVDLGDGTYAVRFHDSIGSPMYYRVDAQLYTEANGRIHNARTPTDVLWAPILEKAMAFHRTTNSAGTAGRGSYEVMNNWRTNYHAEVGAAFGYPTADAYYSMTSPWMTKELFRTVIQSALDNDYPVCLCGPGTETGWDQGMRSNAHLYTVLDITTTAAGTTLTIRNPYNGVRDGAAVFTITLDEAFNCGNGFYITNI